MAKSKEQNTKTNLKSKKISQPNVSLLERLSLNNDKNQSYLNFILGALIVVVLIILVFNYIHKPTPDLGPAEKTQSQQTSNNNTNPLNDQTTVKYTVRQGDTLFIIAQNYYNDGYKYPEIAKYNKLSDENLIEVGQVIDIPKMSQQNAQSQQVQPASPTDQNQPNANIQATGGAVNQTIWGERITSDTYTVVPGDWLSKIAGRTYGDPMRFDKIVKANNIANPDLIEPGTVLKIPQN